MDFIKVYERIRERGMEAEWGSLNNGLPQISVRVLGITFFVVPDHFPGYEKAESDFICLRTFMPMETVPALGWSGNICMEPLLTFASHTAIL